MTTPQLWGKEIVVTGSQDSDRPDIAALADGRFVITWSDNTNDDVRAQILNADGSPHGAPFQIDVTRNGAQQVPVVTALANGNFVVVWTDQGTYSDEQGKADVYGRIFAVNGTPVGEQFLISDLSKPTHYLTQPAVTAFDDGSFAVSWQEKDGIASGDTSTNVWVAHYDTDGTEIGAEINYTTNRIEDPNPAIAALDGAGNYVAVWVDEANAFGERIIRATVVRDGVSVEIDIDEAAYYADDPQVTKLANGGFVVTWEEDDPDTPAQDAEVWARAFDAFGNPVGDSINVARGGSNNVDPVVTALNDGRFAVAWADFGTSGISEVKIQVYSSIDGAWQADGSALVVHTPYPSVNDRMPTISTLVDGRLVVGWWHDALPGIRAQIVDPREVAIDLSWEIISGPNTEVDNDWVGTRFADTLEAGNGDDRLEGGAGADILDGGDGFDVVSFSSAKAGVVVRMLDPTKNTGDAAGDTYISIEGFTGSNFNDAFYGNADANTFQGRAGNDVLYGGLGADTMDGGTGNDIYYVDNVRDRVVELSTGGTGDLVYSSISHTLASYVENLIASGSSSISLTGNTLNNVIKGNAGSNKIYGGLGKDTLYGNGGKDIFVFNTKPSSTNVDSIKDYSTTYDTIYLENAVFTKLTAGKLASSAFWTGAKAHDRDDRIVYDATKGYLYYDADGTGASKQVLIATLSNKAALKYSEFVVI